MDAERFDRLVQSLTRTGSRRGILRALAGTVFGAAGASVLASTAGDAKKRRAGKDATKAKGKSKRRSRKTRVQAQASCCSAGNCTPAKGKNLTRCCYENQTLDGKNFSSSNLTGANFSGASLKNAKFTSANLSGACLVDADITGANFKGANQSGVIKCRTKTSTGFDNSGCDRATSCCQTCVPIGESRCGLGGSCCGGGICQNDVCVCPAGQTNCAGTCVDRQTDENNCGVCGNACLEGETCVNGQCRCGAGPRCGTGLTCCSDQCVDLLTDLDNCTECGNVCPRPLANATVKCGPGEDEFGNDGYGCTFTCDTAWENCSDPFDPLVGCTTDIFHIDDEPGENSANCGSCRGPCGGGNVCRGCVCKAPGEPVSQCQEVRSAKLIRTRG